MEALKYILVECFVCKTVIKYNDAYRKPVVNGDTLVINYMCCGCEEKRNG